MLHRHQSDGIGIAKRGESYVLPTGTGISLACFIPIVNDVLRRKRADNACKGITAIVVYPMNAFCNSQREEPVRFARYTGQRIYRFQVSDITSF